MTGEVVLETARLRLREFTDDDVDALVDLDSDPMVMRYLAAEPTPRRDVLAQLERFRDEYRVGPLGRWAALDRDSGAFLGWLSLAPPPADRPSEADIGWRLRRAAWGRGLATEGAKALLAKAFTELGRTRVSAETMFVNRPSRRVMEKAGMRWVRTFHVAFDDPLPGTEHGEVEYAITAGEWRAARDRATSRGQQDPAPPATPTA